MRFISKYLWLRFIFLTFMYIHNLFDNFIHNYEYCLQPSSVFLLFLSCKKLSYKWLTYPDAYRFRRKTHSIIYRQYFGNFFRVKKIEWLIICEERWKITAENCTFSLNKKRSSRGKRRSLSATARPLITFKSEKQWATHTMRIIVIKSTRERI